MLDALLASFANHLLAPAGWAREKLAPHAGKTVVFEAFPARSAFEVQQDGSLRPAPAEAVATVTIRLGPAVVLAVLADGEDAWRKAEVEGDTAFAAIISQVAANLRWDVEEDLSRVVGDMAAHRLAAIGRAAAAWPKQAARSAAENVAEYLKEENPLLVTPLRAGEFAQEVDDLRAAVDRLEKRVERLTRLTDA